jgi:PAS domain S-box-containing protein
MKITTKFLYLDVLLVAIALAVATVTILAEIHQAEVDLAIKEQDQHLNTFWKLLKAKGENIRIVDGKMLVGNYVVNNNNELPDHIRDIFGCTATVFMGDTRISTNVLKPEGNRAIGTKLQGPAYDALFRQGKSYRGEANILGIPYLTAYDPIRDKKGEVIGALYVGVNKAKYFEVYSKFRSKVIILASVLTLLFSIFAFLLIRFRRKAENAVEESAIKYRGLFDLHSDGILLIDQGTGEILEANASALKLYGYTKNELLGRTVLDLSADDEGTNAALGNLQHQIPIRWHRKKDGSLFPAEIFNSFFTWNKRHLLISAVRDITVRKMAEDRLRESEERLRIAMNIAKLVRWEYDVETGMFTFDDQFYSLYGTSSEQEGGELMSAEDYARKFLPPEESPLVAAEIDKALAAGKPDFSNSLEHSIIRADRSVRYIAVRYTVVCDDNGRVVKIRGVNQDITERKKAELEIQESNERFRVAFKTIPDYISISTLEDGVFVDVNPGFTEVVGYTRDEVIGKSALDLNLWIKPEDRSKVLDSIREKGCVNNLENKYRHKNGHIIDVSMYGRIIKINNKPYMFGFLKDITEQKKAVASLSRLNRTLRTLTKCNEMLVRAENESELLEKICSVIVVEGGYRFAWVGYGEHDEGKRIRPMAYAGHEEGYLEKLDITWAEVEAGMGPSGIAIRTEQPSYVKDIENDSTFAIWRNEALERGYRSSLAVPLSFSGQTGSLNIYAAEPDAFDAEEIELMVQLANDLGYGIKSLRTREKHQRTSEALWESAEEYKKLAIQRNQERNLLRALIDSIPDLIFFKDHESIYLGCNKAFEAFAGRSEKNLIGRTDLDLFPREVGEFFREMDRQMMAQRTARRNEEWVDYPDGRHVYLETLKTPFYDKDGNVLGLIGISRDITARNQAEQALKDSEALLRKVFEAIPDLLVVLDKDLRILKSNWHGYENIVDLSVHDNKPYCYEVFFEAQENPCESCHVIDVLNSGKPVSTEMFNPLRNAYREIHAYPVFDEAGEVSMVVELIKDISELKRERNERKKLEAQLLQAQKMEAIGQLAGGIAHDFNNILTAIIGYAEIISVRLEQGSPLRHFIEQVLKSSERAAELVNSLLSFSRKHVLHPRPVNLCEIVQGLKKMLGRIVREDIDFRTTVFEKELVVLADKGQIEQMLMNFVTNAKDAMPQGGTLSVDLSPVSMDSDFAHAYGFGEHGDYACLSVTDTGCGMDEETQKKIFEPFFTTKDVGKGTGLGMAIIYGIVKQHNGYINVYSELGRGTTFRVYLPLMAEEKGEIPEAVCVESPKGGNETILLVEDDPTVRELHRMILEEAGYTVIEAIDGQDALAKFMKHQPVIDMLATDVVMPNIDGKRLFLEIQAYRPEIKVLFMSGYTKDIVIGKGVLDDETDFISKPVTPSVLLGKVRNILDRN